MEYNSRELLNRELVAKFQAGDESALPRFISINRAMIVKIWKKQRLWHERPSERDELIDSAEVALWRTMKDFDFSYAATVSTFMYYKISGEINSIISSYQQIKTPGNKSKQQVKVISLAMMNQYHDCEHFDIPVYDNQDEGLIKKESVAQLNVILSKLQKRELGIIKKRYGIDSPQMTYEAIGKTEGVTKERIRQIVDKTLIEMKNKSLQNA